MEQEAGKTQVSAGQLAATFNKHFKQAKTIRASNVSRDFGKLKSQKPALTDDDNTQSPAEWFLTEAGKEKARSLVASAIDPSTTDTDTDES